MINMQQPSPDKLFDKYQGQRRNPPANQSVVAQISDRPVPASSIPPAQQAQPVAVQGQPQPAEKPVNPLTALYQSGLMEQTIQEAEASQSKNPLTQLYQSGLMEQAIQQSETRQPQNPLTQLYQSGFMTQSILDAEDKQYEQDLKNWEKQKEQFGKKDSLYMNPYQIARKQNIIEKAQPKAPARDLEQISKDWQLGAKSLRGQELGNILHQIESGQINPEQDLLITQHLEPELPDDIKKQLQISRLTRDKFKELQQQAVTEEQEAKTFEKESLYMNPFQIASDPRFGSQSQRTNVFGRTLAKGATANYAFAPDKDKLNSENPEEQAEERAKRLFYQQQESDYPVTALSGNILGAIAPIGATGLALRSARVAGATSNLRTSLLSANEANRARGIIASRGAPQTIAGTLGESAATGFVYDIASRPEGSEEMNLKENLFARGQNVGFGMATGLGFDLGLMGMGKAWRKLQELPGNVVNKAEVKRRQKLLGDIAEKNGYKNVDDMLDDVFLTKVVDEFGERIKIQTEVLDTLPEFKELLNNVSQTTDTTQPSGRSGVLGEGETPPAATATAEQPAPPTQRVTTGEAEAPVQKRTEPTIEESPSSIEAEAPTQHKIRQGEIIEAPVNELKLSEDVPQFKEGANQQGVVEPLGGTFDRTGVGPIQVWVRNDGSKEVISGRHRLDLARRSGEETIPAQYHYESQGFGKQQAAALDAILNIREGQGKVKDYVDFIQATKPTKAEADAQGILARATGRRAYTIADSGTDALITAHRANQLTDEAATRIAAAAPNNEALQAVGIKAIQDGKTITVAENMVKAVKTMTDESAMKPGGDMFGFDDSALKEAEALARKASAKQADIQKTLSAVQGAAKNPERAAKEGVDVKDPEAVKRRIAELKQEKQDWQNWHTNPELTAQLRGEEPSVTPKAKQEPSVSKEPSAKQEPKPPDQQEGFDLTTQTEAELSARAKTASEAEAAQLKQQQDLEAKARADQEAKGFELGIQGSGKDVSAKQTDLLGTGSGEQPNRQPSVKPEPEPAAKPTEAKTEAPEKTTIANNPDPKAKDLKGGPYTIDYHNNIIKALKNGKLSVDEYKASFQTLIDNKDKILKRLNKYTKAKLMGMANKTYAYPRDVKKSEALEDAYNRLLKQYLFGRPTAKSGPVDIFKLAKNKADFEQSVKDVVANTKQADLDSWAKTAKDYTAKKTKAQAEKKAKIANPQTLEDYQLAIRENGKESLTKAQTAEYERLTTEADWQAREARQQKENIVKGLETEEALEIQPITEGAHSKTGETIYNVKVETKLGKQKFQEAAQQARAMKGGYYKGNFWLKTREEAEQFIHWLNGKNIDRTPNKMAQETSQATKQVDKLRTMADKLEQQGTAELNAPRTTNTARQMDQAASARGKATKKINFAQTLKNIADGIEDGSVRFLSKLSNMTQLDTLNRLKRRAVPENMMDNSYNGYSMSRQLKEGVSLEDYIDKIEIPKVELHKDKARELAEQLKGKRGFAPLRHELEKQISIAIRSDKNTISMNPHSDYAGMLDNFVRKYDADPGWLYQQNMEEIKRLQRMGITSDEHLRSAIRELETVRSAEGVKTPKERKLDDMRFKIKQGVKQFNDFFPTPEDIVNRVMELANIRPGMKTLEPNAGMGHIAKKLQAAAGKDNVDMVEMSGQLVDYLKTAGHKVTQSDFLKFGEKGAYERIVMNPPFSKDQDIDHVMHAYELLKPGGKMTAIMSNMAGLRTNKKNRAFSQWLDDVGAHVEDLEAGAFKSSFNPTSVNTKVVVVEKPTAKAEAKAAKPEQAKAKAPKETPAGTSIYSTPIIPAFKEVASIMHLNPGASFGGAVYGGIYGGDKSETETYSPQWWLDSAAWALAGAAGGGLGGNLLTKTKIKGKTIFGETSYGNDARKFVGKQISKLPGMDKGNQEAIDMAKQQALMKALIERQAEKAAEYLYKNFTPAQRATMADLIEGRGIIADGNLLHRQAKELDDFISYTSKKMQELGMLSKDIEPGAYLHRYYSKHLGLTGLARALTPKGKAISGTWSIRRGTQEVFDDKYMSKSMRDTMNQIYKLEAEYKKLENKSGDLVGTDTRGRMAEIKTQLKELQSTEFREYLAPENGTLKSFFMAADEVPTIPGLKKASKKGLPEPAGKASQGSVKPEPPEIGSTGELVLTDRRWTIDGMKAKGEGILHRDWTKAERQSWGEIDDAAYRMLRGQAEVAHDLSLGTFYKAINDRFNGTKVSDVPIEGWQKVPETEVKGASRLKKYGALEGKYVSDDIWRVIKNRGQNPLVALFESSDMTRGAVPAVKTYLKLLSKWKAYKTVYNPVSHMNNSVGNLMMYNLSDYEYKYLAQSFKELRKGDLSEWVREARNNGLFGNDWTSEITGSTGKRNIDELLEKIRTQPDIPDFEQSLDSVMQLKQWFIESSNSVKEAQGPWKTGAELAKAVGNPLINTAKKPLDKATQAAQTAYRMEDEFFKLAVYMAERQKGTNPLGSVKAANRYFFDYNDLPDAVKMMRDLPLGSPFISYTALAIPAIVRTAIEKPEKIFAFVAALEGMNYTAMHLNGELREEGYWDRMAAKNEIYPDWMKGRSFFGALNNLTMPFTASSYEISLANMLPAGNPTVATSERSEGWPAIFSAYGSGIEGSNPIVKLLYDLTNNQDWQGNEIYNEQAPKSEKRRKVTNYIYQNITPSNPLFPASYHNQKILEGASNVVRKSEEEGEEPNRLVGGVVEMANAINDIFTGGQFTGLDRRENEILFRDALFGSIGIKLRPVRIDQFADSKNTELEIKKRDLDKWMSQKEMAFEQGKLSERQFEKDQAHYKKRSEEFTEQADRITEAENILMR